MFGKADSPLRQRAEYTQKFNQHNGRHGWLRLTPSYSVKMVQDLISMHPKAGHVLDPFCGTGTTALNAVNSGYHASTIDINPFLVWLSVAKTRYYSTAALREAAKCCETALDYVRHRTVDPAAEPQIHNSERWWPEQTRLFLCYLLGAIQKMAADRQPIKDLLEIAFCRTLIQLSSAAFNHQSMSFKEHSTRELGLIFRNEEIFARNMRHILGSAMLNPSHDATIILGDSRYLAKSVNEKFDLVITSPPYANRMSYIRELRPYMYWLNYLKESKEAADLDWRSIGGTWGSATSRLKKWREDNTIWLPDEIFEVLKNIRQGGPNGIILSQYVHKYFEDMSKHFSALGQILYPGANIHYIVGNSTFYNILVSTEQLYAAMIRRYGFIDVFVEPVRKRNSKKALIEFVVSAKWPS